MASYYILNRTANHLKAPDRTGMSADIYCGRTNHMLSPEDMRVFTEMGLADPINDIVSSLAANSVVIPQKGVLGGTMGFYDKGGIVLLGPRWAFAPFTDGHIEGFTLLGYKVLPGGEISWEVIDSFLK